MPRRRSDPAEVLGSHMTFRISAGLREHLAAAAGGRPIGDEIRRRLELSFEAPASTDPATREFIYVLTRLASAIGRYYEPWHKNAGSFDLFCWLLNAALRPYQPEGEPVLKPKSGTWAAKMDPDSSIAHVGAALMSWELGSHYRRAEHPGMYDWEKAWGRSNSTTKPEDML